MIDPAGVGALGRSGALIEETAAWDIYRDSADVQHFVKDVLSRLRVLAPPEEQDTMRKIIKAAFVEGFCAGVSRPQMGTESAWQESQAVRDSVGRAAVDHPPPPAKLIGACPTCGDLKFEVVAVPPPPPEEPLSPFCLFGEPHVAKHSLCDGWWRHGGKVDRCECRCHAAVPPPPDKERP